MNKIREIRKSKHISQQRLAAMLNVNQTAISQWETGKTYPNIDTAAKLADIFGVSMEYLLGKDDDAADKPKRGGVRIPVYGDTAAGVPIYAISNYDSEDPDDWEEIPESMAADGDYIALRIKGDSMEPRMRTGDVVIVRLQPEVDNGDIAIVRVNGEEATCKKIKKTPDGIMLISLNPAYEPMFYSRRQVRELPVSIIGRVVELRAKF